MADPCVVGLDVGGSHSRAVLATVGGRVLGTGRAGGGNPTVLGAGPAIANIVAALKAALGDVPRGQVRACVVGLAGVSTLMADPKASGVLEQAWADAGLGCPVRIVSDVTVSFAAGTPRPDGTLLVSGTGAVAARMHDRLPARFRDGYGWLLGDDGSGFWIGRQAARATIAAADGRAPMAELAKAVLAALLDPGTDPDSSPTTGRTGSVTSGRTWPAAGLGRGSAGGSSAVDGSADAAPVSSSGDSTPVSSSGSKPEAANSTPVSSSGAGVPVSSSGPNPDAADSIPVSSSGDRTPVSSSADSVPVSSSSSGSGSETAPNSTPDSPAANPPSPVPRAVTPAPPFAATIGEGFTLRGRRQAAELVRAVTAQPTVALARLAPLVMTAYELGDPAARRIVEEAARVLVDSLAGVGPMAGEPVVLGGSVLVSRSPVFEAVRAAVRRRWPDSPIGLAHDGAAGASWLAARDVLGEQAAAHVHTAFTHDDRVTAKFS